MAIYGFNHDDLVSGGKAAITFGLRNLMSKRRGMNKTDTNAGSFVATDMYKYLRDTVLPSLPADLRSHIKAVNKRTSAGNKSKDIRIDEMSIFLFSLNEVYGSHGFDYCSNDEGSKYAIFSSDQSRKKYLSNGAGRVNSWWLRSPGMTFGSWFCAISDDGEGYYGDYLAYENGVCFGFCV